MADSNFIKETLNLYGSLKSSEVIDNFWQGDKVRVIGRFTYDKKITSANIIVETHFFYKNNDINGVAYNMQGLIFIGKTPVWGYYKKKFANFGIRSSGIDNSLATSLNMKAITHGFERMTDEEIETFTSIYEAYANRDTNFFNSREVKA